MTQTSGYWAALTPALIASALPPFALSMIISSGCVSRSVDPADRLGLRDWRRRHLWESAAGRTLP